MNQHCELHPEPGCQVAGVLRDVAAGKGDVLRYSGDDFVTVFFKATEEELSEIQKEMCRRVEALRFPELPGVQLKLVTAGTSIPGKSRRAKPLGTFVFPKCV